MRYLFVEWVHTFSDEPIYLYYELDAERHEHRKVEQYRDGTMHSADATHGQGSTFLAWEPHPPLDEIASDSQFRIKEIMASEFEEIWSRTHQKRHESVALR